MKTVRDRVIVKPLDKAEVTEGGIFIPSDKQSRNQMARVITVGKGKISKKGVTIDPEVKEGDLICVDIHAGQLMRMDDGDYYLIKYSDILGVYEE